MSESFEPFATRSAASTRRTTAAEIEQIRLGLRADQLADAILRMGDRIERAGYECGLALARGGDWKKHLRASNRRLRALARLTAALCREVTR